MDALALGHAQGEGEDDMSGAGVGRRCPPATPLGESRRCRRSKAGQAFGIPAGAIMRDTALTPKAFTGPLTARQASQHAEPQVRRKQKKGAPLGAH